MNTEVKCSYVWDSNLGQDQESWRSPEFSSEAEGTRKLEWNINYVSDKGFFQSDYHFYLNLLTDIEDDLDVTVDCYVTAGCLGLTSRHYNSTGNKKTVKKDKMMEICSLSINSISAGNLMPGLQDHMGFVFKLKCDISYMENMLTCGTGSYAEKKSLNEDCTVTDNCMDDKSASEADYCVTDCSTDDKSVNEANCGRESDLNEKSVKELLENIAQLLMDPKLTDVTLRVKRKEFRVHKNILSVRCPVLAEMIEQDKVELEHLEPETVKEVLNFNYTGSVPNLTKMAEELLIAADRFELKTLKKMAEIVLIRSITIKKAINLLLLADECSAQELKTRLVEFIAENVEVLKETKEWETFMKNHPLLLDLILLEIALNKGGNKSEIDLK